MSERIESRRVWKMNEQAKQQFDFTWGKIITLILVVVGAVVYSQSQITNAYNNLIILQKQIGDNQTQTAKNQTSLDQLIRGYLQAHD